MSTSKLFNFTRSSAEQDMLHGWHQESIKLFGIDVLYIPRVLVNLAPLYRAATVVEFREYEEIEVVLTDSFHFGGDGDFFSKFGVQTRDQVTFHVASRTFESIIGGRFGYVRPREGDLIWFPQPKRLFQIQFTKVKPMLYPLGTLPTYEIITEHFEYSSERFLTGIPDIDRIQRDNSIDGLDYAITTEDDDFFVTEDGDYLVSELFDLGRIAYADNEEVQEIADDILDFTDEEPFSRLGRF